MAALADPGEFAGLPLRARPRCAGARRARRPMYTLDVEAIDETNARVRPDRIAQRDRRGRRRAWSCSSACSRTSFRARSISRGPCARRASPSASAASTSPARSPCCRRSSPTVQQALDMGVLRVSPARPRKAGSTSSSRTRSTAGSKPIYNFMNDLPGIEHVPTPHLPAAVIKRTYGANASFDAGRGCPFQCSFCTIINVQGRKSRRRSPDDVERIVRDNAAQGIFHFFITDDNFARNKDWEPIFDRLIQLREVEKISDLASSSRSTRSATGCRTSSRRRRAPASSASSSGSRTSARTTSSRRRRSRTRSPNTARCCSRGRTSASSPIAATSSASRTTRPSASAATSR